jgi:hypothetical protein
VPVGIATFTILSEHQNKLNLELKPIIDVGIYLRKEERVFA